MMKKLMAWLMAFALLLGCCAYAEETAQETIARLEAELAERDAYIAQLEARIAQLEGGGQAYDPQAAAAEFDGGVITVEEARVEYEYRSYYYELFEVDMAAYADEVKMEVLSDLVEDAILRLKAQEMGVYELSEERRAQLYAQAEAIFNEQVEYYQAYRYDEQKTAEEIRLDTIAYLEGEGYTLEGVYEALVADEWRTLLYEAVTADVTLTEEELAECYRQELASQEMAYSANYEEFEADANSGGVILWNPEGVRAVRSVFIAMEDAAYEEYLQLISELAFEADEEKLARVDELYAQLETVAQEVIMRHQQGDDFLLLIDAYGDDAAMGTEPIRSRGYYVRENSWGFAEGFVQAAMALENVGDISAPVQVDGGIYIIEYYADVSGGAVAFDAVKDQLYGIALEEKKSAVYNAQVQSWIEQAGVVYYPERF